MPRNAYASLCPDPVRAPADPRDLPGAGNGDRNGHLAGLGVALLKLCVIMDIDGTLANAEHRIHLLPRNRPDVESGRAWEEFFAAAVNDTANDEIVTLSNAMQVRFPLFILTGRSSAQELMTRRWLKSHDIRFDHLWMRPAGDRRDDTVIKAEMLARLRELGFEPLFAVEDRARVAKMFRDHGVRCLHVCEGDY